MLLLPQRPALVAVLVAMNVLVTPLFAAEGFAAEPVVPKRSSEEIASVMWRQIKTAEADPLAEKGGTDYWFSIQKRCAEAFLMVYEAENQELVLKYFVEQFGKDGPDADMRWILVGPNTYTLPGIDFPPYVGTPSSVKTTELKLCELIVKRCLKDRGFLERYYRAVIWSDLFLKTAPHRRHHKKPDVAVEEMQEGFSDPRATGYWWYARNLVVLAYALGREDLLKDADPNKLDKACASLATWYSANRDYLAVDAGQFRWRLDEAAKKQGRKNVEFPALPAPAAPFPDWKKEGPTPMDRGLLYDVSPVFPMRQGAAEERGEL